MPAGHAALWLLGCSEQMGRRAGALPSISPADSSITATKRERVCDGRECVSVSPLSPSSSGCACPPPAEGDAVVVAKASRHPPYFASGSGNSAGAMRCLNAGLRGEVEGKKRTRFSVDHSAAQASVGRQSRKRRAATLHAPGKRQRTSMLGTQPTRRPAREQAPARPAAWPAR